MALLPRARCSAAQVSGSGYLCGGFTPLSWPSLRNAFVGDSSGRTCLFSLVNAHGRPVRLRLSARHGHRALHVSQASGPGFGVGADLLLMEDAPADQRDSCYARAHSFELDQRAEAAAGLPPVAFAYDSTLLAGGRKDRDGNAHFAAREIECYAL